MWIPLGRQEAEAAAARAQRYSKASEVYVDSMKAQSRTEQMKANNDDPKASAPRSMAAISQQHLLELPTIEEHAPAANLFLGA